MLSSKKDNVSSSTIPAAKEDAWDEDKPQF